MAGKVARAKQVAIPGKKTGRGERKESTLFKPRKIEFSHASIEDEYFASIKD